MKKPKAKLISAALTAALGVCVFLFWYVGFPHALSYHEQYQLFLWTSDYLLERISVPGGVSDWIGEFIVQFYYIEWIGALLLALLFMLLLRITRWLIVPTLLLWLMGDPNALLSYAVALTVAAGAARINKSSGTKGFMCDIILIPFIYWASGPMAWVYVLLRSIRIGWLGCALPLWLLSLHLAVYQWLLPQWPLEMVLLPELFYRIPLQCPTLMWMIPLVTVVTMGTEAWLRENPSKMIRLGVGIVHYAACIALLWTGISKGYDREMYELIWQDYQVRNEQWDAIIERAKEYQVKTSFSSVCVNLALAEKRMLADRMFDFYQSGEDALIMPRIRDLTSMLPSMEVFWRLGMVNAAQRYAFDTQESILNGRKSGRCTKRIAECMLVNGHLKTAEKQLSLLRNTLFYRHWAQQATADAKVKALRYQQDFLFSYAEMDKMLGLLFMGNKDNKMALDYFIGQLLLKGDVQAFAQYLPMVQQYGGYQRMPLGYQDVALCIQRQGNVPDSPYANYVKRISAERRNR